MTLTGRCLCGAVSYECSSDPVLQFNCHCRDCQQSTGAAYAPIMFFRRRDVHINGALSYFESVGGSGKKIRRGFCPTCGAQMIGDVELVQSLLSIRAGTLDDPSHYRPGADIFCSQAAPWDCMDAALPKFPGMVDPQKM
ncbi:GFA family protein [Marinobacteraceae bacterium S3BR75-40.1]